MMNEKKIANPSPLGLLGFGMTTVLLNLHNLGITELDIMIVSMGFALGGMCQIIAGIMEFKRNNTFGATAFFAYGFFWWSLIVIWCNPTKIENANKFSMGWYLLLWATFTLAMSIGTLKHNIATRIVFFSLALLFFLLSIGDFANNEIITKIAGAVGIFCGLSAIYNSCAQVINEEFQKEILPLGNKK